MKIVFYLDVLCSTCEIRRVTISTRIEVLQNSLVEKHAVGRYLCWSFGEEAYCAGTDASMTEKGNYTGPQECDARVSKLGIQCHHCTASHRWLCVYGGGCGKEMVATSFFVTREVSPLMLLVKDLLLEEQIFSPLCAQELFKSLFLHCLPPSCLSAFS